MLEFLSKPRVCERRTMTESHEAFLNDWNLLYDELKRLAYHRLKSSSGNTFSPTILVHELFLKLGDDTVEVKDKPHFLAMASRAMRFILIDHARRKQAEKRGQNLDPQTLTNIGLAEDRDPVDLIHLGQCLERLARLDSRLADLVDCRFFGGLSNQETAQALGMSLRTVERQWLKARVYLKKMLDSKEECHS